MSRIVKEPAVILKTFDFSDSSLIAVALTGGCGKIRVLAKGAKRAKSRFGGALRTGNILELIYYDRPGGRLKLLKEVSPVSSFDTGGNDLDRICIFQAGLEVMDRATPEEGADGGLFSMLEGFVSELAACSDPWALLFWLETGILSLAGVLPVLGRCPRCKKDLAVTGARVNPSSGEVLCGLCGGGSMVLLGSDAVKVMRSLAGMKPSELSGTVLDGAQRKSIGRLLHRLLACHVDGYRLPNALGIIKGAE